MNAKEKIVGFFKKKEFIYLLEYFKEHDELNKDYDSLIIVGISYSSLKNYEKALQFFYKALDINYSIDALYNIALTMSLLDKTNDSKSIYIKILQIDNEHVSSYINLSDIYIKDKEYTLALNLLKKVITKYSKNLLLNFNYSIALLETKNYHEAVKYLDKSIELDSTFVDAHYNKANCLKYMGSIDKAISIYERIILNNKQHAEAKFNLGVCLLLNNQLKEGLELYENRFLLSANYQITYKPSGEAITHRKKVAKNSRLLVIYEQGLGDSINFSCYINYLLSRYDQVFVLIQPELLSLFDNSFDCEFYTSPKDIPEYDYYIFMASLPLHMIFNNYPLINSKSYLKVSSIYLDKWKTKINCKTKKIGISWCSNKKSLLKKNIDDDCFLNSLPNNYNYFCLHKDISSHAKKLISESNFIHEFCDEIDNFHDTAAICSLMDYVITIDTSVAHLSSALGKKTQLILSFVPDWRWGLRGDQTIWYECTKLIRSNNEDKEIDLMKKIDFNFE